MERNVETGDGFNPALVAWAELQREERSHKSCLKYGVGGMIRRLRAAIPENGIGSHITGARSDVQILEGLCRRCGKCWEMRAR